MELLYGVYAQYEYVGIYLRCPSSQCERLLSEKDPLNMYEIYITKGYTRGIRTNIYIR